MKRPLTIISSVILGSKENNSGIVGLEPGERGRGWRWICGKRTMDKIRKQNGDDNDVSANAKLKS